MKSKKLHLRIQAVFALLILIPAFAFAQAKCDVVPFRQQSDGLITRAEALALILQEDICKKDSAPPLDAPPLDAPASNEKKPFRDVKRTAWYFDLVVAAKKKGLVKGYKKGAYFKPDNPINLAEALRMIFKHYKVDTATVPLDDLPKTISKESWYAPDIAYALGHTIIAQQTNEAVFPPGKNLTRDQLALLLYRFLENREESATFGYASWYGDGLSVIKPNHGNDYLERNLTAAHRALPFGTIVQVTNIKNGKMIEVVINDRGPFVTGRIIDLSKTAFSAIADAGTGIISVQLKPLL